MQYVTISKYLTKDLKSNNNNIKWKELSNSVWEKDKSDTQSECEKEKKTGYVYKSASSAIPSGISRDCRMVALGRMSRHIAGSRLRRFNIHPHVYRYPRAAKALSSKHHFTDTNDILQNCIIFKVFFRVHAGIKWEWRKNEKEEVTNDSRRISRK